MIPVNFYHGIHFPGGAPMGESNVTDRQEPKTGADSTRLMVSLEQQQQQQRDVFKAGVSHNERYEDKGVLPKVTVLDDTPKEVAPPPGVPALRPSKYESSKPPDAPAPQRLRTERMVTG
jgi:hypothetical protein